MAKTIWDLKRFDVAYSKTHGEVIFMGFYADGFECEIQVEVDGKFERLPIPTSDLFTSEAQQEASGKVLYSPSRQLVH